MHRRERAYYDRDNNRLVRPFEWGLPFVVDHVNGADPRRMLKDLSRLLRHSKWK